MMSMLDSGGIPVLVDNIRAADVDNPRSAGIAAGDARTAGKAIRVDDHKIATLFESHLAKFSAWVKDRPNIQVLDVDYNNMVADPGPIAVEIDRFLGGGLATARMTATVDPSHYRNRAI